MAAIVGGGRGAKPGEISLAHHGVLFLDELPEFPRTVLETLRQPIETGDVVVARANAHVRYPCRFMLVAAANPCRCGHLADPGARLRARAATAARDYLGAHLRAADGPLRPARRGAAGDASRTLGLPARRRDRAPPSPRGSPRARARAARRASPATTAVAVNADAEGDLLEAIAALDRRRRRSSLADVAARFRLSARGYHRVLRVARTIADLEGSARVEKPHVAEAAGYRLAF